jgi:hypothetical protein
MPLSQDIADVTWHATPWHPTEESRPSLKAIWIGYGTGIPGSQTCYPYQYCTCTRTLSTGCITVNRDFTQRSGGTSQVTDSNTKVLIRVYVFSREGL